MAENKAQQSRGDSTLPEADEEQPEREGNIHGKLRQYGPGLGRPGGFSKLRGTFHHPRLQRGLACSSLHGEANSISRSS